MRNLSWRAKVNRTTVRLIALSKQPEFHSTDLARIHPIIKVLAQGSYRFESLSVMNTDGWKRGWPGGGVVLAKESRSWLAC